MIRVSEAFDHAEQLGLDAFKFFEVATQSTAQFWFISKYCPAFGPVPSSPANHDYTASMMLKDLNLAADAAQLTATAASLGTEAMSLYNLFCKNGGQALHFSGILKFLRGNNDSSP